MGNDAWKWDKYTEWQSLWGSIPFQNQVSLPSWFSGTTRSNKPSSWGLLLPRSASFPPFFFPWAGAALRSLNGKTEVYFFFSFSDSHLCLWPAKSEEKNNKTNQSKNPRSWSSFPRVVPHRERNGERTQECAAVCKGSSSLAWHRQLWLFSTSLKAYEHLKAALVFLKQNKMVMTLMKAWDSYWRII